MNYQHQKLAAGKWKKLPFCEQMANVGSEAERAINWRAKNNSEYAIKAFTRMLELLDLTIRFCENKNRLQELTRVREVFADYFVGKNQYGSSATSWKKYFFAFNWAARAKFASQP